ncbi:SIP domain-containing protein [Pectobacterium cacticida]|uniref:SIP domain-containing protein n=1 Tax=Pectobacterium cacticida TaxID=69221 RepID=UPI0039878F89
MATLRTPLADQAKKNDLIEHLNDDHPEDVLSIAQTHCSSAAISAQIADIFEEGCLISVTTDKGPETVWLPFVLKGEWEEQVLYLAYDAMVRQGKPLSGAKKQYFTVLETHHASKNMLRLVLKSQTPLVEDAPGFAWLFSLKVLTQAPANLAQEQPGNRILQQWWNRAVLWLFRHASASRREKIRQSLSRDLRYYTLRSARKSHADSPVADIAEVDVYLHGETQGSVWARQLKAGDVIHSTNEYREQTAHLHQGQTVLIADETALPTVAALLESWKNPVPPVVIAITNDPADQEYLPDGLLPPQTRIHRLDNSNRIAERVIQLLREMPVIDGAWGALEHLAAKQIRQHLRDERQLGGKQNRVKGYWRATAAHPDGGMGGDSAAHTA